MISRLASLAVVLSLASAVPAAAQSIAAIVNREAVTSLDVAQRQRFLALTQGGRAPPREQVLNELIDERLKTQEARRLRITITEAQVDTALRSIAERTRLTPENLARALQQRGVNIATLRNRLRADLGWQQVVQQRAQRTVNIRDQDVVDAIRRRGQDPNRLEAFEYTLAQVVVFGLTPERRRAAEALRSSVRSCDTLQSQVRATRDAAARPPVRRVNQELPQPLREQLDRMSVGQATAISQGQNGFEFAVICSKRSVPGREAVSAQVRQELLSQELEQVSRRLLDEARTRSQIERRAG
jgi:peptidyl-prolyl cis-trans isomerase SurA